MMKHLKQIILLAGVVLGTAQSGTSQVLIALIFGDKLNSPNLEFGIGVGASINNLNNVDGARYKGFFNAGLYFNVRIKNNWWFHPEVQVKATKGAQRLETYTLDNPDLNDIFADGKIERRYNAFEVPLLVKYRSEKSGFAVEAGIQPALNTKANDYFIETVDSKDDAQYRNEINDRRPRMDFGLAAGVSWRPRKTYGVTINLRFTEGLIDLDKTLDGNQTNRAFNLQAQIPIGVKKAEEKRDEKANLE